MDADTLYRGLKSAYTLDQVNDMLGKAEAIFCRMLTVCTQGRDVEVRYWNKPPHHLGFDHADSMGRGLVMEKLMTQDQWNREFRDLIVDMKLDQRILFDGRNKGFIIIHFPTPSKSGI